MLHTSFLTTVRRSTGWLMLCAFALTLVHSTPTKAQNLIADPSFEIAQNPNRYGQVFPKWQGTIYEPPAKFVASHIAHSGELSCEMIGDPRTKIRIYCPPIKTDAGRYQVKAFIRGMDLGKGQWGPSMDFCCGFDGKFIPMKKYGTFGWTPLTYVFDYPAKSKSQIQVFIGLLGGGRLWVDDVSLVKVDDSVALTPEPVIGQEEAPIAPPQPLGEKTVRCPDCQFLNAAGATRCYACGTELLQDVSDQKTPPEKIIADFSNGKNTTFINGKYTTENVPTGNAGIIIKTNIQDVEPEDWSKYDYFRFDTFNPSDKPVTMTLEMQDKQTHDYWTRVNAGTVIPPGKSTISFSTNLYVGEKSRPGRMLLKDQITRLIISVQSGPIIASNFRLDRLDTDSVKFNGLYAFSFGPFDAPIMEGFNRVPAYMTYDPGRGYGWVNANFWRIMNVLQPDSLTQCCETPQSGSFRMDLPNGSYHVIMNLDSPGGYWGETQTYKSRQVTANGKVVVHDTMTIDTFIPQYFRNAHHEDLPGLDTFNEYVQKMFHMKEFDVDVTDGKLELGFKGETWANCLSHMIVYPNSKAEQGKAFADWVTERRKAQFNDYFKQIEPKRSTPPASGYVLFTRPFTIPVDAYDGPGPNDAIGDAGLSLTVAKQEISPLNFAVQPSSQDLGAIDLKISKFVNENGAQLDQASFTPGWIDYRITRVAMDGSVYSVAPRYWYPIPAPSAPKVTRRFWIRVQAPTTTAPGIYKGTITVQPEHGEAKTIPVALTVLPFDLDPITDVAAGPFGCTIQLPWNGNDPKAQEWNDSMFSKCLDVIHDSGSTSFTGIPTIRAKAHDGQIDLDFSLADKQMAIARSKGFHMMIGSYGTNSNLQYTMYGTSTGPDEGAAKNAGFKDMHDFLSALYTAIDKHAQEANWLPVAWNLCDEPLGEAVSASAANALAHRQIMDGLKLTTFTGATSVEGNDPKNPHMQLLKALPIPSLNDHDEASLQVIKDADNQFSFYNGGTRWTYGRYMKMLVVKYGLVLRTTWHFANPAGDPYYALDCREDDYCWFNTDENQNLVPSVAFMSTKIPGLNDYRYLSTLQRLLKEKPNHPAAAAGQKVFDEMMNIRPKIDRNPDNGDPYAVAQMYQKDRDTVVNAIVALQNATH